MSLARQVAAWAGLLGLVAAACGDVAGGSDSSPIGSGAFPADVQAELDLVFEDPLFLEVGDLGALGRSGDLRMGWILVDLLRFNQFGTTATELEAALAELTGVTIGDDHASWVAYTELLFERDVPAPPEYVRYKRAAFVAEEPGWEPFFDDDADLDWRSVTWGGVFRDHIPVLVDPPLVPGSQDTWTGPDDTVFVVDIDGDVRAYPFRVMEVHELALDVVGGQPLAITLCTLCGSAVAFRVGDVPGVEGPLQLATSGLLQQSNKLMYDRQTESLFEQFSGRAVAGPLHDLEVELDTVPIEVTTKQAWLDEHPNGQIVAEGAGTNIDYPGDIVSRRSRSERLFPVPDIDDRLPPLQVVLGVADGVDPPVAFPVDAAREALRSGAPVQYQTISVVLGPSGGLVATGPDGTVVESHESNWFAWAGFEPDTVVWVP